MSSATPGHADQYATRNRRQSSLSQTSLQNHLDRIQPYSPNRSEILLPSTTFRSTSQPRSRTPSVSNNLSRIDTSIAFSPNRSRSVNPPTSANPDEFYRQYPTDFDRAGPPVSGLHQEALRSISTKDNPPSAVGSNGSYSTNWSIDDPRDSALPPSIPGLKARKASVKNLVAQINASSTIETPPIPGSIHSVPSTSSASNSTTFLTSAHTSQFGNNHRNYSTPILYAGTRSSDSSTLR